MKVVLLEGLGVSEQVIEQHARKLESMGHTFVAYPKNTDPLVQAERSRDADVIMLANMPLAPVVLEEAKNLKFIDVAFTGVDHIPMAEAKQRGIAVSNASGYATQAVAELCVSFMIQLLRNVGKTEERCRNGGTKDGLVGNLLCGKTVGIVGAGAIGKKVAALCKAFGCSVLAYNRSTVSDPAIDEQVNTARGGVLDSAALADALEKGEIAGAACDVFETEPPLPTDHPLLHCPNTIVTPHIAFASVESMEQRADIVFNNLYSWLDGKQVNAV